MKQHGYNNYEAIDKEVRTMSGEQQVLGQLRDGTYEVDVVDMRGMGKSSYELVLRHGQHIHVSTVNNAVFKLMQWATGFHRPAGGQAIVAIKSGVVVSVSRHELEGETA